MKRKESKKNLNIKNIKQVGGIAPLFLNQLLKESSKKKLNPHPHLIIPLKYKAKSKILSKD